MKLKIVVLGALLPIVLAPPARSATTCGPNGAPCVFHKTPYELILRSADFSQPFGSDPFTVDAVVATNNATQEDATSELIATMPAPAVVPGTETIIFAVTGGVKGQNYRVGIRAIDSTTGEKLEATMTVIID